MTKKKEKTFEDNIKEQSRKFIETKNKLRLVKWLASKEEEMMSLELEVKSMLVDCKKGDFSNLPDLSQKEQENIFEDFGASRIDFKQFELNGPGHDYTYTSTSSGSVGESRIGAIAQSVLTAKN